MTPRRIVIIGTSGTGKSTLARAVGDRLGVPHVELDALHWGPNWTPTPADVLQQRIAAATAGDGWVVDGNYFAARGDLWDRADTIVWLDYALPRILWQLTGRTWRRCANHELLWGTCHERGITQLFTRDSIFWWVLTTWRRRRREFPPMLAQWAARGTTTLRFRTPIEMQRWFDTISERDSPLPVAPTLHNINNLQ